jgi:3-oxoadipate enol-lactonase
VESGPPHLPPGRRVELGGRGTTFVREATGPAGAPTVVLLHGWTVTADLNWFLSYGPLSRHFRVLAPDLRGHGRGVRSRRPFRLEDCADDVAALAEATGTNRLIAVGYSMGGPVAQLLWRRHPALVAGLVMCATAARLKDPDLLNLLVLSGLVSTSVLSRVAPPQLVRGIAMQVASARTGSNPLRGWILRELQSSDPRTVLEAGAALRCYDSSSWVGWIDAPTAVVVTVDDAVVSPARQRGLAAAIAGSSLHEVRGGHAACAEPASRFVPALVEATKSVASRAARPAAAS